MAIWPERDFWLGLASFTYGIMTNMKGCERMENNKYARRKGMIAEVMALYYDGYNIKKIADLLDLSESTVRSVIHDVTDSHT